MDDETGALQAAAHGKKARRHYRAAISFKDFRPDDDVGDVGFIFESHEHDALRGARALTHQDQAGGNDERILRQGFVAKLRIADSAEGCKSLTEEADRMLFQR